MLRVHKSLINALLDHEIRSTMSHQATIRDGRLGGFLHVRTKMSADFVTEPRQALCLITAAGEAQGSLRVTQGNFRISGTLAVPFTARKKVVFDGKNFVAETTSVHVRLQDGIDNVTTLQNSFLGRVIGKMVLPCVRRSKLDSEQAGVPIAKKHVIDFMDRDVSALVDELNQVTPLEKALQKLFPKTKDWTVRLSTTKRCVQVTYGPPNSVLPKLPENPKNSDDVGIEFWVRTTPEEAKFIETLGEWNRAHNLLEKLLGHLEPTTNRLLQKTVVVAIGP